MIHAFVVMLLLAAAGTAQAAARNDAVREHFAAVRSQLDPRAQAALNRIAGTGRQLLAARSYLRAGSTLEQRWSWSEQQIRTYAGSAEQRALDAAIDKVRTVFEQRNPGYTLFVNPQVRSLDLQLQRWNQTRAVTQAAEHMEKAVRAAVRDPLFPAPRSTAAAARFRALLENHRPQPDATLAAPGLSGHGQMGAVDFQVRQGSRTIAGADSTQVEAVWIGQGWRDRLKAAVVAAGTQFIGPLVSPAEPWHYDYQPGPVPARPNSAAADLTLEMSTQSRR